MSLWTTLAGATHVLAQMRTPYIVAALGLYIFSIIVTALRWRMILGALGCRLGIAGTLLPYLSGVCVGNLTPARTLGADACRIAVLRARARPPVSVAAASVLYDRFSEVPPIVALALLALPTVRLFVSRLDRYLLVLALAGALVSGAIFASPLGGIAGSWLSNRLGVLRRSRAALNGVSIDRVSFAAAVGLSSLVWLQDVARLMLVAAAFRVVLTPSQAATLSVLTIAGAAVPSIGGLGIIEGGLVGTLVLLGVRLEIAMAITAAERAISYAFATGTGAVALAMIGGRRAWSWASSGSRARFAAPAAGVAMALAISPADLHGAGPKPADLAPALTRFEAALRADPGSLQIGARYRQLAIQAEEYDRAIHLLKGLASDHRNLANAQISLALAYVDKVPVAGRVRQAFLGKDAIDALGHAITLERNWIAYYMRGVINLYYGRVFNRVRPAIDDLEHALAIQREGPRQSYHARTFVTLGDAYWKLGDLAHARAVWSDGLKAFSDDGALTARLANEGRALENIIEASLDANRRQDTSLGELSANVE
jgi:uncharacterized membrane protein YbhN (UPF0104 family)